MSDSPPPTIDITIAPNMIRLWSALGLIAVLISLGLIGAAASPIVDGHPVVLTRDRLAIKHYLEAADRWSVRLDDIALRFDALGPSMTPSAPITSTGALTVALPVSLTLSTTSTLSMPLPIESPLPSLYQPASQPLSLYDRAQQAEQAITDLQTIEAEMQRIAVPPALSGLHARAQSTLQEFARWSAALLDHVGAPSSDTAATVQTARDAAGMAWQSFKAALATQRGTAP